MSAGLIALSLRSDKHIRSVPIFSLVVLLIGAAMSIAAVVTAAPSPDIQRFTGRGGKLIQTAGWNDSVVAPDGSIDYFFALTQWERLQNLTSHEVDKQIAKLTPQFVAAHTNALGKQVRQYHRLFMLRHRALRRQHWAEHHRGGMRYRDADHHAVSAASARPLRPHRGGLPQVTLR